MSVDFAVPAAAQLTELERCSDCRCKAVWAGERDLRVCPACFSVLWHVDWFAAEREARAVEYARRRAIEQMRDAMRKTKREAKEAKHAVKKREVEKDDLEEHPRDETRGVPPEAGGGGGDEVGGQEPPQAEEVKKP